MYEDNYTINMKLIYTITMILVFGISICSAIKTFECNRNRETYEVLERFEVDQTTNVKPFQLPLTLPEPIVPFERDDNIMTEVEAEPLTESIVEAAPESTVADIELPDVGYLAGDPAIYLAKTVWGEARGCSVIEQAAVIWCVLNRVDSGLAYMPDDIISVITQVDGHGYYHFRGYNADFPVTDEIYELVVDVLARWELEKTGVENVGRVLPKEFLYFHGDGVHNYFRDEYSGGNFWDWSLPNPYVD